MGAKQGKKPLIEALLKSGEALSTRDIADLSGSTVQFVNRVRGELKAIQGGSTLKQNVQRLNQDVKDLRALVLRQGVILGQLTGKSLVQKQRHERKHVVSIAS